VSIQIEPREREKIVILDLKGRLILEDEHLSLLQQLLLLLDSRRRKVIVNLQEVSSIDTGGLETIAFCATCFGDSGGRLVLLKAPMASAVQPDTVLETYQEEIDAVNSFFPDRVIPRYDIHEFVQKEKERAATTANIAVEF
jgi:anti-sigma B factor antagonist